MKWLLDTNVVSESGRLRPDARVMSWLARQRRADVAISAVTWAELKHGIRIAPDRRQRSLNAWFEDAVAPLFADSILPVGDDVLLDWIGLSQTLSAGKATWRAADLLIASTARTHNLGLVSRNVRDFARTGVTVYDPWTERPSA